MARHRGELGQQQQRTFARHWEVIFSERQCFLPKLRTRQSRRQENKAKGDWEDGGVSIGIAKQA